LTMQPVDPERFADVVGTRLRHLPMPSAPRTLLPRVMAAAERWARRPWYARAWFSWPLAWQAASIAVLCVLGAGAVMLLPGVEGAAARIVTRYTAGVGGNAVDIIGRVDVTIKAALILWRTIVRSLAPCAFAFIALMCLACAVLGAALNHVAFGRTVLP
jgi:hypothetical protein